MQNATHHPMQSSEQMDEGFFLVARLGEADDDHVLSRGVFPPGLFIPLHRHGDIECIHVLDGSLDVYLGSRQQWFTVGPGRSILVKGGDAHAIRNVTDQPADGVALMTVKLARFISELGDIAKAAGRKRPVEERRKSLREHGERYGYWLAPEEQSQAIRDLPASAA